MESIFSSNSSDPIQRRLDITPINSTPLIENIDHDFDIDKCVDWIKEHNFKKVALQFPDEILKYSVKINSRLQEKCSQISLKCFFFILADTSYGSCCVDTVAAEHYNADSLIHYGHSCLSVVDKLPVFYVYEKLPLDVEAVKAQVKSLFSAENAQNLIILYDVCYFYLYDALISAFEDNSRVFVTGIKMTDPKSIVIDSPQSSKTLFSRVLPAELNDSLSKQLYSFLYIGSKPSFLTPFQFYFNRSQFFQFNPLTNNPQAQLIPFAVTNRELMKRFYLIEKARDAQIFGILIGTMSVSQYKNAIDHVSDLLKRAKRRFYSFLIGKLNCPKLNNFMEVDMYVLVACSENSLINSKELNKPIITVYELEMAFNCARLWGEEFVCDFRQLLPGSEHYIEAKMTEQESDVSLITGSTRILNASIDTDDQRKAQSTSLISRGDALSVLHYSGAGEFLQKRSWIGLEQHLGETEVTKPVEGRKGIAASYQSEPTK